MIDTVLRRGDVLYMPRGYVHVARTDPTEPSFHATIALATHDWTLPRLLSSTLQNTLESIVDYRMAVPREFGMQDINSIPQSIKQDLQEQVEDAFRILKDRMNLEAICEHLSNKYARHNERALPERMKRINEARTYSGINKCDSNCGPEAAATITLSTILRASTPSEKERVKMPSSQPRGLHVREEAADSIVGILQQLKAEPSRSCKVSQLRSLLDEPCPLICELTLLSFAKSCVELGALAIVKS